LFLIRYGTQFAARNVRYWHKADINCFGNREPKDSILGPLT